MARSTAERAKPDDSLAASTVPAALIGGVAASAAAFGMDEGLLLRGSRIAASELADPAARLPLARYVDLWDAIALDARAVAFALSLGSRVRIAALGVVGYAMQHAPTIREAYACFSRFSRLVNDRLAPEIEERTDAVVFRRVLPARVVANVPMCIAGPLTTLPIIRDLTGLDARRPIAVDVALPCAPPADPAQVERTYGCPVRFHADAAVLRLHREVFDLPVRSHDAALFQYLSRHAQELSGQVPDSQKLSDRLRVYLLEHVGSEVPSARAVAKRFALSERTLHRRLSDEGTTFASVLEQSREQLAKRYLRDPSLTLDEVAFLLGYSEASTFHRAFRRWTGSSPGVFRRAPAT